MAIHQDKRRTIHDWANGNFKSLKVVYVHESIPIGDHFHNNKDEVFFLAAGILTELVLGEAVKYNIDAPYVMNVPRGLYHKFTCTPGSIIFCGATEFFDKTDEIKNNG